MPDTIERPSRNGKPTTPPPGREVPPRSALREPEARPDRPPLPPFADRRRQVLERRQLHARLARRVAYLCAAIAMAASVGYGMTGDAGFLLVAVLATGGTVVSFAAGGE